MHLTIIFVHLSCQLQFIPYGDYLFMTFIRVYEVSTIFLHYYKRLEKSNQYYELLSDELLEKIKC
jgi:hypothetical protein